MYTEDQIKSIARAYAIKLGEDPEELVGHSAPAEAGCAPAILLYSPRWMIYTNRVRNHLYLMDAINETLEFKD